MGRPLGIMRSLGIVTLVALNVVVPGFARNDAGQRAAKKTS